MNNTLGKKERLKSQKLIGRLFEEGISIKIFPFRLIYIVTEKPLLQSSFSVPKRNFKNAVDRIKIKRVMREAYRLNKSELFNNITTQYAFMILYIGTEKATYSKLEPAMIQLFKKFILAQKN